MQPDIQMSATPHAVTATAPPPLPDQGWFVAGTEVMTTDGLVPVEWIMPGDRVLTRRGSAHVQHVNAAPYEGRLIRLSLPARLGGTQNKLLHPDQIIFQKGRRVGPARSLLGCLGVDLIRAPDDTWLIQLGMARSEAILTLGVDFAVDPSEAIKSERRSSAA